jgi:glycerol-3-phosphate acyltransferase PlsY
MWWLKNPDAYVIYAVIGCLYVWLRHISNIKRLLAGTEPRLGDKPKELMTTESENIEK